MTTKLSHEDAEEFVKASEAPAERPSTPTKSRREQAEERLERMIKDSLDDEGNVKPGAPCQWASYGPGYRPTTATTRSLPAGVYSIESDQHGPFAIPTLPPSGLLLELPEMRSDYILKLVEQFWGSEKDYKEGNEFVHGGAAFKAGIMIFGPPGSGKSCTIKLLSRKLVASGGTVFFASCHPANVSTFLADFARVEPNRKSIVIFEDFDSLTDRFGEANYLEILDSAKTIDNVLFIATTNYPDRLDPRIYNRPGRFSHVVKVGMPTRAARKAFLEALLKDRRDIGYIVDNTDGFSVDHLSSLVNAVYREKKVLVEEIQRLRTLFKVPKADDKGPMGLGS